MAGEHDPVAAVDPDRGPEIVVGVGARGKEPLEPRLGRAVEAGQGRRGAVGDVVNIYRELDAAVGRRRGFVVTPVRVRGAGPAAAVGAEEGGGDVERGAHVTPLPGERDSCTPPPVVMETTERRR